MEAILLIGIQGSGKSTFYRDNYFSSHLRLSLDMLKTRNRQQLLMNACLSAQQRYVVDNTNVLIAERKHYIQLARQAGFRVSGYFFEPDLERALRWNQLRCGKAVIPEKGIRATFRKLERPTISEGFDELLKVVMDADQQFALTPM